MELYEVVADVSGKVAMRRMGVKQIAVHGGTRAGAPRVMADFAKYAIGKG
ncbi:MAG TPA: hypothetical protein VNE82_05030 [Candidatus Binataceae bacterium]|nr:hypothetical protein [Candidatus Binataceae bacterium]